MNLEGRRLTESLDLTEVSELCLGFRLSRYGVKERKLSTSHGITHSRCEEGFPVISRLALEITLQRGKFVLVLPDKEFRYLSTVIVHKFLTSLTGVDHIFIPLLQEGALRMASEDSLLSALR